MHPAKHSLIPQVLRYPRILSTRPSHQSSLPRLMLINQIHLLNRMQQHPRQTHPPLRRLLHFLPAIIIDFIAQPPLPQIRRVARMIVPRRAEEIMLSFVGEHRRSCSARRPVVAVVEDGGEVGGWPGAVDVDGMRCVHGFVAVV